MFFHESRFIQEIDFRGAILYRNVPCRNIKGSINLVKYFQLVLLNNSCDKWVPVITAWRVLKLQMKERLPLWRVAANILNKQSRTADKGWSSSLEVGRGANNFSPLKRTLLWNIHRQSLGPGLIRTKQRNTGMRFGNWNVRNLYRAGSLTAAARELARYKSTL